MEPQESEEERAYREIQREADRISAMIVSGDRPAIDLMIAIRNPGASDRMPRAPRVILLEAPKDRVASSHADRVGFFELIYETRFRRLWEQFRCERDGPLPEW